YTTTPGVHASARVDHIAPPRPSNLSLVLHGKVVTVRWRNPRVSDFRFTAVRVSVTRQPRTLANGTSVYRGKGTTARVHVRAGQHLYVAVFALDRAGNVSKPAVRALTVPAAPAAGAQPSLKPKPKAATPGSSGPVVIITKP